MALKLIEGFDHFNSTALAALKGWTVALSTTASQTFTAGRINGSAVQLSGLPGDTASITKDTGANYNPVTFGFAFQVSAIPGSVTTSNFVFAANPTGGGVSSINVGLNPSGKLEIRNAGSAVVATGTTTITVNTWNYVEVVCTFNNASSTVELHLNGAVEIPATTVSMGTATGVGKFIGFCAVSQTGIVRLDDLYVCDTSGSLNTGAFLGDSHVETIYPNADGTYSQWTPNTGVTHFNLVNEHTSGTYPDEDTTYVADATSGHKDSYTYNSLLLLVGTVFGIQTNLWARKDDAALRQIEPLIRISSTDYTGTAVTLATSYVDYTQLYDASPATSAHFTVSEVNDAEFGVQVV